MVASALQFVSLVVVHSSLYLSALQFVSLVVVHSSESKTFRTSAHEDQFVGFLFSRCKPTVSLSTMIVV